MRKICGTIGAERTIWYLCNDQRAVSLCFPLDIHGDDVCLIRRLAPNTEPSQSLAAICLFSAVFRWLRGEGR